MILLKITLSTPPYINVAMVMAVIRGKELHRRHNQSFQSQAKMHGQPPLHKPSFCAVTCVTFFLI